MFKLIGKEINAILGAQTILIWTYEVKLQKVLIISNDPHLEKNSDLRLKSACPASETG